MKFHWNSVDHINEDLYKFCVELEYQLRPVITRFLISRVERECSGDYSAFHFNVDLNLGQITISEKTPARLVRKVNAEFDREINKKFTRELFRLKGHIPTVREPGLRS